MTDFIYQKDKSLSYKLCDEIIMLFEGEDKKFDGRTIGGVNKKVKDTTDFLIPHSEDKCHRWFEIESILLKELQINLLTYIKNINKLGYSDQLDIFRNSSLQVDNLMVQKYVKGEGKYIYHLDSNFDVVEKKYRVITYLWYLNTIEQGGETEFWDSFTVKPEQGKLILFPATWTYPHRGKMPITDNKYIITGWFNVKI